jgi:hypothetical protein
MLALTFSVGPETVQCDTKPKIIKQFDEGPHCFIIDVSHAEKP